MSVPFLFVPPVVPLLPPVLGAEGVEDEEVEGLALSGIQSVETLYEREHEPPPLLQLKEIHPTLSPHA